MTAGAAAQEQNAASATVSKQSEEDVPAGALTWDDPRHKGKQLQRWRLACIRWIEIRESRQLRLAWALEGLFNSDGYAFPTNGFLADITGMADNKIQAALLGLEIIGAIIRARSPDGSRRIYPCRRIIECKSATPPLRGRRGDPREGTPVTGVQNKEYQRPRTRGVSSTMQAARAEAELRQMRAAQDTRDGAPQGRPRASGIGDGCHGGDVQ